jgi:ribosomal-protein-alanine N-acetyltransferase
MTTAVQIRAASLFDSTILETLHRWSCVADWDEPWSQQSFAGILATPGALGLLAVRDGEPVGFALGRVAADEGEVLLIATHPAQRRQGVARILLRDLLQLLAAAGAARVFLEVAAPNAAALALYRGAGFDTVGRRPNYYRSIAGRSGESAIDALLLSREF